MPHSAIAGLPDAYLALAPELAAIDPPAERIADCAACPMVRQPGEPDPPDRMVFDARLRCCTYNPVLPNYLVGRILRRGGPGEAQVRARIADPEGVTRWAIVPQSSYYARAAATPFGGAFGRDVARQCPYWVPGGLNCSIWEDRNAVCRAWFCRHEDGIRGRDFWLGLRDLLRALQVALSGLVGQLEAPPDGEPDVEGWCAFYLRCADRLDGLDADTLKSLDVAAIREARARVTDLREALRDPPLPERPGACVSAWRHRGDHVILEGYSHYTPTRWDPGIFTLFSRMDGTRTWREALDAANADLGRDAFTEADLRLLHRMALIEARTPEDLIPGARLVRASGDDQGLEPEDFALDWGFGTGS